MLIFFAYQLINPLSYKLPVALSRRYQNCIILETGNLILVMRFSKDVNILNTTQLQVCKNYHCFSQLFSYHMNNFLCEHPKEPFCQNNFLGLPQDMHWMQKLKGYTERHLLFTYYSFLIQTYFEGSKRTFLIQRQFF